MGFHCVYLGPDDGAIIDGDHVASNSGWAAFVAWAVGLGGGYGDLAELAEEGVVASPDELSRLQAQLRRALREQPGYASPEVMGAARRLLACVRARPDGCTAMMITDGSAGPDD